LEKSDETRVSVGIDGYSDNTGRVYYYDSLVPNHRQINTDDSVILRKENNIVGIATIQRIETTDGIKTHKRCSKCGNTDIRERKTKLPKYKCAAIECKQEFDEPTIEESKVTTYAAHLHNYKPLMKSPRVSEVKQCAFVKNGNKSQLSMLAIDQNKIIKLIPEINEPTHLIEFSEYITSHDYEVYESKGKTRQQRRRDLENADKLPEKQFARITVYNRNADVVAEVLERSEGICEECKVVAPFNRKSNNSPYLEVHHKIRLADGGEDTVKNAMAVCPNCHRKLHYG